MQNMDMESFIEGLEKRGTELFDLHRVFCQKILKLPSSAHAVVANGKVCCCLSYDCDHGTCCNLFQHLFYS